MNRNYSTPKVSEEWIRNHWTDPVVAVAIHAIADKARSPEAIWSMPTDAEWNHVCAAVEEYISHGDFKSSPHGYRWGCEKIPPLPCHGFDDNKIAEGKKEFIENSKSDAEAWVFNYGEQTDYYSDD